MVNLFKLDDKILSLKIIFYKTFLGHWVRDSGERQDEVEARGGGQLSTHPPHHCYGPGKYFSKGKEWDRFVQFLATKPKKMGLDCKIIVIVRYLGIYFFV